MLTEVKANLVANDHFRLLAIPFGGPLGGKDLDGEWFSRNTDIKPDWFSERPVLWHHGQDRTLRDTVIGKAVLDEEPDEDGWWVDVWLKHGERRTSLVKRLAEKAPLFGSSGTIGYLKKSDPHTGEILVWPYVEQTLTTSPQNTFSVTRPAKAVLDAFHDADITASAIEAAAAFEQAVKADLRSPSTKGEVAARAGLMRLREELEKSLVALRD